MDRPLESLLASLRTSPQTGLTSQEAARRLAVNGRNELTSEDDDPLWKKFAEMFKDPMISLLLASAIAGGGCPTDEGGPAGGGRVNIHGRGGGLRA